MLSSFYGRLWRLYESVQATLHVRILFWFAFDRQKIPPPPPKKKGKTEDQITQFQSVLCVWILFQNASSHSCFTLLGNLLPLQFQSYFNAMYEHAFKFSSFSGHPFFSGPVNSILDVIPFKSFFFFFLNGLVPTHSFRSGHPFSQS